MVSVALASHTALVILMTSLMPLEGASGQEPRRDCCVHAQRALAGSAGRFVIVERDQNFAIEPAGRLVAESSLPRSRSVSLGSTVRFDLRLAGDEGSMPSADNRHLSAPCKQEASHAARR